MVQAAKRVTKRGVRYGPQAPRDLSMAKQRAVALLAAKPGLSVTEVCRQVGTSRHSVIGKSLGVNGDLRAHVRALLAAEGFDDRKIVKGWAKQARAQEVKHFSYQGKVLDTRRVAALDVRTDALTNITKLARLYPEAAEEERSKQLGPLALTINLNQAATEAPVSPGVSITLGPTQRAAAGAPAYIDDAPTAGAPAGAHLHIDDAAALGAGREERDVTPTPGDASSR